MATPDTPQIVDAAERQQLHDEQLRLHPAATRGSALAAVCVAAVLGVLLQPALSWGMASLWLAALALVLGLSLASGRWAVPGTALSLHRAGWALHGLVWAAAVTLLPALSVESQHDALVLGVVALIAAAAVNAWFDPVAVALFVLPAGTAVLVALLDAQRYPGAAMLALYALLGLLGVRRSAAQLADTLRLRRSEDARRRERQALDATGRALSSANQRLALLEQHTSQGVLFTDAASRVTQANPALAAMLGTRAAQLLGYTLSDWLPAPALERLHQALQGARQHGHAEAEFELPGDGARRSVLVTASALGDAGHAGSEVVAIWTDITERRRAERDLRTYQVVTNSTADLVSVVDEHRTYRLVNDAWCRATGMAREQAIGLTLLQVPQPQAQAERLRAIDECLAQAQPQHVRSLISLPGAGDRVIDTTYYPYSDPADGARCVVLVSRDVTVEVDAFEQLQRHDREQRALLDAYPGFIARVDREMRYTYANAAVGRLLGQEPQALLGRTVGELAGPAREAEIRELFDAVVHAGDARVAQRRYRSLADGRELVLQMHFAAGLDPGTGQRSLYVFGIDVSERVRAESAVTERETELRALLEAFPGHIGAVDQDGRYVYVNAVHAQLLGRTPESMVGQMLAEVLSPGALQLVLDRAGRLDHGVPRVSELHLPAQGGKPGLDLQVTQVAGPRRADGRRIYYWFGIDIGDRVRAEAALLHREAEMRAVLEAFPGHILAVDDQRRLVYVNARESERLGRSPQVLVGMHLSEVISAERYQAMEALEPLLRAGQTLVDEVALPAAAPRDAVVLQVTRLAGPEGPDGHRIYYQFGIDVSERKRAEVALRAAVSEAERANRAKSDFLAHMSHELRTPMNAILGFGQLLQADRQRRLDAAQQGWVREILRGGRHLLELINDVLDLGRIEAGKLPVTLAPVALGPLVDECLSLVQPLADERQVQLPGPGALAASGVVRADPTRLKQVLVNLLSNAVKYNHGGGQVRLRAVADGAQVRVEVHDTGPGLDAAQRQRLFQVFERLGADRTSVPGSGVGLALSRRLMLAMHGDIGVDSEPGRGSCFWLLLQAEAVPPAGDDTGADEPGRRARQRVIYLEDNPVNAMLLEAMLEGLPDLELTVVGDAAAGLELIRRHPPDLVLTDIQMPGVDGHEVLRRLRAHAATRQVPVIAVSANAMPGDVTGALGAGFADYLTKPLELDRLLHAVHRALGREVDLAG